MGYKKIINGIQKALDEGFCLNSKPIQDLIKNHIKALEYKVAKKTLEEVLSLEDLFVDRYGVFHGVVGVKNIKSLKPEDILQ